MANPPFIFKFFECIVFGVLPLIPEKVMKVPIRGFFCDDTDIRYPYKDSSHSNLVVGSIGYLLPIFTVNPARIKANYLHASCMISCMSFFYLNLKIGEWRSIYPDLCYIIISEWL